MIICIVIMAMVISCLATYAVIITTKACSLCATNDELRQDLHDVKKELNNCRTSSANHRDDAFRLFITIRKVWDFWESHFPDKFSVPVSDYVGELLGCSLDSVRYNAISQIDEYTELCLKLQEEVYARYVMRKAENNTQEEIADDTQGAC